MGVDFFQGALIRAYQKGIRLNREITIPRMGALATREIFRVLKAGGQSVITYPSNKEGMAPGLSLVRDSIRHSINQCKYLKTLQDLLILMTLGILYLPVLLRANKSAYSYARLGAMFAGMRQAAFQIEEYPVYNDYIVYGNKGIQFSMEEHNAS